MCRSTSTTKSSDIAPCHIFWCCEQPSEALLTPTGLITLVDIKGKLLLHYIIPSSWGLPTNVCFHVITTVFQFLHQMNENSDATHARQKLMHQKHMVHMDLFCWDEEAGANATGVIRGVGGGGGIQRRGCRPDRSWMAVSWAAQLTAPWRRESWAASR